MHHLRTKLPTTILTEISAGQVKKIVWASFGSALDSWFFAYETADGIGTYQLGSGVPSSLRDYVEHLSLSTLYLASLRVQLGDRNSYVVWSRTAWACSGVPKSLRSKLVQLSSNAREHGGVVKSSLSSGRLENVQWHRNGSFYMKSGGRHSGHNEGKLMKAAWDALWQDDTTTSMATQISRELAVSQGGLKWHGY